MARSKSGAQTSVTVQGSLSSHVIQYPYPFPKISPHVRVCQHTEPHKFSGSASSRRLQLQIRHEPLIARSSYPIKCRAKNCRNSNTRLFARILLSNCTPLQLKAEPIPVNF
jgi:hypothetical protein